jgi:hypothetical protein
MVWAKTFSLHGVRQLQRTLFGSPILAPIAFTVGKHISEPLNRYLFSFASITLHVVVHSEGVVRTQADAISAKLTSHVFCLSLDAKWFSCTWRNACQAFYQRLVLSNCSWSVKTRKGRRILAGQSQGAGSLMVHLVRVELLIYAVPLLATPLEGLKAT